MVKFELIPTVQLSIEDTQLRQQELPELVYLDDPAFSVMMDFSQTTPHVINQRELIDDALNEMKLKVTNLIVVTNRFNKVVGMLASEDILGEKPIKIMQEGRIPRDQITVKMVMVPVSEIPAFELDSLSHARVGNVVNTLKELKAHYAFVIRTENENQHIVLGLFNISQISKQLHTDIENSMTQAESVSELQKRSEKD